MSVLKSDLRKAINEVLEVHGVDGNDVSYDIQEAISSILEEHGIEEDTDGLFDASDSEG